MGGWIFGCGIFGTELADHQLNCIGYRSNRAIADFTIHEHPALVVQSFLQYQVGRVMFPNLGIKLTDHSVEVHLLILPTSIHAGKLGGAYGFE